MVWLCRFSFQPETTPKECDLWRQAWALTIKNKLKLSTENGLEWSQWLGAVNELSSLLSCCVYKYGVLFASCNIVHKDKVPSHGRDVTALAASTHGCGTAISLLGLFSCAHSSCHSGSCHVTENAHRKRKWGWKQWVRCQNTKMNVPARNHMAEVREKKHKIKTQNMGVHILGHSQTAASVFRQHTKQHRSWGQKASGHRKNTASCEVLYNWTSG